MTYRSAKDGEVYRPTRYSIDFYDHHRRRRRFVAFADKQQSALLARKIQLLVDSRSTNEEPDPKLLELASSTTHKDRPEADRLRTPGARNRRASKVASQS